MPRPGQDDQTVRTAARVLDAGYSRGVTGLSRHKYLSVTGRSRPRTDCLDRRCLCRLPTRVRRRDVYCDRHACLPPRRTN